MSALRWWLQRWQPIQTHRAVLTCAGLTEVCAAMDATAAHVVEAWRTRADAQRRVVSAGGPVSATTNTASSPPGSPPTRRHRVTRGR